MGTLFLVATPIGNLEDITLRAIRVLREVSLVAAEDTRTARVLLRHYDIDTRVTSYNEHNHGKKAPEILSALDSGDVALTTDAGMPAISDPGQELVAAAASAGHKVVPIPGASAVVSAIAASGLTARRFHFLGFLPRQRGARLRALSETAASGDALVIHESPHRIRALLEDISAALGDRQVAVARELTKLYEEVWRGTASEALSHFTEPRGEFTIVVEGKPLAAAPAQDLSTVIAELRASDVPSKMAVAEIMHRCGLPRREAYDAWHRTE